MTSDDDAGYVVPPPMTDQVVRLFGDELFHAWSETLARAALYTLTDEHIHHATIQTENDRRHVTAFEASLAEG